MGKPSGSEGAKESRCLVSLLPESRTRALELKPTSHSRLSR